MNMMGYWQWSSPRKMMVAHLKIILRFGMGHRSANEYQREEQVATILKFGQCQSSCAPWLPRRSPYIERKFVDGDCCAGQSISGFMASFPNLKT